MGTYEGELRMLGDGRMRVTAGGHEIGDWSKDEVRIHAEDDGFHVRAEGEEVVLDLRDDAHFAVDYGLRSAPPLLRRRMAGLMRDD